MEIRKREELEGPMRERVRLLLSAHRKELAHLLGQPPDIANVPASFWRQLLDDLEAQLVESTFLVFRLSAQQHGANSREADQAAAEFARTNAYLRVERFLRNAFDRLSAMSRDWRNRHLSGERITRREIDTVLVRVLRASGLIETEFTRASVRGGEWAVAQLGLIAHEDRWYTNPRLSVTGPCPICRPLHNTTRAVWGVEFPDGPPAHVNCQCEVVYLNVPPKEVWGDLPVGR